MLHVDVPPLVRLRRLSMWVQIEQGDKMYLQGAISNSGLMLLTGCFIAFAVYSQSSAEPGGSRKARVPVTFHFAETVTGPEVERRKGVGAAEVRNGQLAIREDGSYAEVPDDQKGQSTIVIVPTRRKYVLDRTLEMVSTTELSEEMAKLFGSVAATDSRCSAHIPRRAGGTVEFLGHELTFGFQAAKYRFGSDPKDAIGRNHTQTLWLVPDLDCTKVREEIITTNPDGTHFQRVMRDFIPVKLGTPDPALFDIPDRYKEVLPSEMIRKTQEKAGKGDPTVPDQPWQPAGQLLRRASHRASR